MARLLLSGWLILASLALAMPFHEQQGSGSGQNFDQSLAVAVADTAPYVLAKTVHQIPLARKQVPQGDGPDLVPKIGALRDYPGYGATSVLTHSAALYGFVSEHILYRSGSRAISSRAPPAHFSG